MRPLVGFKMPKIMRIVVDLPAPFGGSLRGRAVSDR
jgi:hypothetical protein